jgi:epoxyqueuosine reductase QueG
MIQRLFINSKRKDDVFMNNLKKELIERGASLVGFADIEGLYNECDLSLPKSQDSVSEPIIIPMFQRGVSIAIAIPKEVIRGISQFPTNDYYNAYHSINNQLDALAVFCAEYLEDNGYNAYAQTVSKTKEFGIFTTVMPHKTVAISGGLGWIGKSALLVTPQFGSAIRLTSVLTDAPLPVDHKINTSKCGHCQLCKNACPAGAITGNLWSPARERDWIFNAAACRKKAREIAATSIGKEITLCGKCIEVCPYTKMYIDGDNIR